MRAALFGLLLCCACITDAEVQGALGEYCAVNEGHACQATSQCCAGNVCVNGACAKLTAGVCLFPADAGRVQGAGEDCGCANDCVSGVCTASKCP